MIDVQKGATVACLPQAQYTAKLDAGGQLHEVTQGETLKIPDDSQRFTLSCDRSTFPDTTDSVIKCRAQISLDGGQKWQLLCGFTTMGGAYKDEDGALITQSSMSIDMPAGMGRIVQTTAIFLTNLQTKMEAVCR